MSTPNLPKVESGMSVEQLANLVAILIKELTWLLTGHLDVKNIRAEGIETRNLKAGSVIAEKIDVAKLSAISADLGHITAGLIEAITIIGSLIQTAAAGQRIELSSVQNLLKAVNEAGGEVRLSPNVNGSPALIFQDPSGYSCFMYVDSDAMNITTSRNINLIPGMNYRVNFENWNKIYNTTSRRTLQQEFDIINARLAALGG